MSATATKKPQNAAAQRRATERELRHVARSVDRVLRSELKSFALRRILSRNHNKRVWSSKQIICLCFAVYGIILYVGLGDVALMFNQGRIEAFAVRFCNSVGLWFMAIENQVALMVLYPLCFWLAKNTLLFWGDYEFSFLRVQQKTGREQYPLDVIESPYVYSEPGKTISNIFRLSKPGWSAEKVSVALAACVLSLMASAVAVNTTKESMALILGVIPLGVFFGVVWLCYSNRVHSYPALFASRTWSMMNESSSGSVLAVVRHKRTGREAVIHLKQEGPLSVTTFGENGAYQPGVLRPISKKVHDIAFRFNEACDVFLEYGRSLQTTHKQGRPLSWVNAPVQAANRQTTKQHAQPTVLSVAEKKARAKKIWEDLILDEKVKDELIELALHFDSGSLAASKGLLLYGPPGTGKTLIARKLSETMGAEFFPVTVADLKGPHIGHTAERTKAIWAKALAAPKAVLFVDECEGAFGARGAAGVDQFTEELVQTFISQWDGFSKQRNVWVVGATNLRDKIDAAVLSRFGEEVQIPLPGSRERVKIFQQELAKKGIRGPLPAETEELTQGFSGRDLENIAGRIARKCEAAGGVTLEILEAVTRNKRAQGSTASDSNATWDRLVLPEQTLQTLKNTAELFKHAEEFERMNISMPRGILLYGPAGTGKTQIARTLAKESGLQFIAATTGDLKANYLGQSANKVKMLFERARGCAPCILFIDELDIVAPDRGSRGNDALTQEIVGQLLQELDGVKSVAGKIFLLGATNLLDSIDSAIRSRFPTHIEIPPPDEEGIAALLRVFLGKKPINFDLEAASRVMAKGMVGFSGRDIRSIVERAEQAAVGRAIKAGKPQSAEITLVDLHAALPSA